MPLIDKLKQVSLIVDDYLPYDKKARNEWEEKAMIQKGELLHLSDYIENGAGVCRDQALLSACLMEKLQEDGFLEGEIHVERNQDEKHGHEWATFSEYGSDDVYVIDVAQHYVGKKENSPDWNYHRP